MSEFYVKIGQTVSVTKTVSENDLITFADITGDNSPNHVDEAYMEQSPYGKRIAHGALIVGYMSHASTLAIVETLNTKETPVSVGYDKVRFLKPVFIGDTLTILYTFKEIEPARKRSYADIKVTNQDGLIVAVSRHILQWIPNP